VTSSPTSPSVLAQTSASGPGHRTASAARPDASGRLRCSPARPLGRLLSVEDLPNAAVDDQSHLGTIWLTGLSSIPEVLLVTGRQPGAGPGRGGSQHLIGWAGAEEGADLPEPARPVHCGVRQVVLQCRPDPLGRVVVRAVPCAVQQLRPGVLVQVGGDRAWWMLSLSQITTITGVRGNTRRRGRLVDQALRRRQSGRRRWTSRRPRLDR
jgi:hypothetical protein